jgi:hypothetical protein
MKDVYFIVSNQKPRTVVLWRRKENSVREYAQGIGHGHIALMRIC